VGDSVAAGESFGEIESVKSVSELFSPVTGTVSEVNASLDDTPELVNNACYGDGWMVKVTMDDSSEVDGLMTAAEYETFVSEEA